MVRLKGNGQKYHFRRVYYFNSYMVRLKDNPGNIEKNSTKISIPIWYD